MTYDRTADGSPEQLRQRNVDTGTGLERVTTFLSGRASVWETDELAALTDEVVAALGVSAATLGTEGTRSLRIVADHRRHPRLPGRARRGDAARIGMPVHPDRAVRLDVRRE